MVAIDAVHDYFLVIRDRPVLTAGEERQLCRDIEIGVLARDALDREISPPHRRELSELVRKGDDAFTSMVHANLRLVVSIARKHRERNVPFADLIQDGNLGLLRAVQGFDHARGYRFSTYATFWIKEFIEQGITRQAHVIKVPHHRLARLSAVRRLRHELAFATGHEPSIDDLAEAADLGRAQLEELLLADRPPSSLQMSVADGVELADVLSDMGANDPVDSSIEAEEILALERAIAGLDDDEREVLHRAFGLGGHSELTLRAIADELSLTRPVVSRLLSGSMQKLGSDGRLLEVVTK